eukprot:3331716-Prymnesium_polylepis.1
MSSSAFAIGDAPEWAICVAAGCVTVVCILLGCLLISSNIKLPTVNGKLPPALLSFASGLLIGIALFDIMPDATLNLEQRHGWAVGSANLLVLAGG